MYECNDPVNVPPLPTLSSPIRFDLAIQLKELRIAYQIAQETDVSYCSAFVVVVVVVVMIVLSHPTE